VRWLLVLAVAMLGMRTAHAHQTSLKYVDLAVGDNTVEVSLRFAPGDVTEPMGLSPDASPAQAIVLAHPAVPGYVQHWLSLTGCDASAPTVAAVDATYLAVSWTARCPHPRELALDFTTFFALDTRHEAVVQLTAPHADAIRTIVGASTPRLVLRAGHSPSLLAWIRTGMDHIYGGLDHMLFVVTLLLVVMLEPSPSGWIVRGFVPALRSTATVITAFTIAHSFTLIAAALGVVTLPSRLVESLIALSIAYTAVEDVIYPAVRWRFWLTFAFGLVHGLGFASQLSVLLPPTGVVVPLLCFNVGVEIGQLTVVVIALPALYVMARGIGAPRYRRALMPGVATLIFLVGFAMVIERVFAIRVLPM
jgi:hypothetical protein